MILEAKKEHLFTFSVLTSTSPVINSSKASSIAIATVCGNISVLYSHISYITEIDYGIAEINGQNAISRLYLEDGVLEVANNNVNVLVKKALYADQIDIHFVQSEIERIQQIKYINIEEDNRNKIAIKKLMMQLKFAGASSTL